MGNERVNKVLEILTGNISETTDDFKSKSTMRAIMKALLGREPEEAQDATQGGTQIRNFGYSTENLRKNVVDYNEKWSVHYSRPYQTGKLQKPIVKVWRKIMAPVLRPLFERQSEYNAAMARSVNELTTFSEINNDFMNYQNGINRNLVNENRELKAKLAELEKRLGDLENHEEDLLDYKAFEDNFRGEEAAIRDNLKWYLPYFEGKDVIYDIGCGRGEFLELLMGAGLKPVGIDNYPPFIEECLRKGLNVLEADGVKFIADCKANSADAIMLSQVAEHLPKNGLISVVNNGYKALKEGGCLIMETPNPLCLSIYRNAFYTDPTHSRPVHPQYLEFLFKQAGFKEVKIVYTEPSRIEYRLPLLEAPAPNLAQFNDGINVLSDILFGSQDYTIIGIK